jgi:hypothetical protein
MNAIAISMCGAAIFLALIFSPKAGRLAWKFICVEVAPQEWP